MGTKQEFQSLVVTQMGTKQEFQSLVVTQKVKDCILHLLEHGISITYNSLCIGLGSFHLFQK